MSHEKRNWLKKVILYLTEILPVVEFVLEEGLSDEDALHLIQQSGGSDSKDGDTKDEEEDNHWKRSDSGTAEALTFDGSPTHAELSDDPFTANLMNFYVSMRIPFRMKKVVLERRI